MRHRLRSQMNFIINPQSLSDFARDKAQIICLDAKCLCNEINVLMAAHCNNLFFRFVVVNITLTISQMTQRVVVRLKGGAFFVYILTLIFFECARVWVGV